MSSLKAGSFAVLKQNIRIRASATCHGIKSAKKLGLWLVPDIKGEELGKWGCQRD